MSPQMRLKRMLIRMTFHIHFPKDNQLFSMEPSAPAPIFHIDQSYSFRSRWTSINENSPGLQNLQENLVTSSSDLVHRWIGIHMEFLYQTMQCAIHISIMTSGHITYSMESYDLQKQLRKNLCNIFTHSTTSVNYDYLVMKRKLIDTEDLWI